MKIKTDDGAIGKSLKTVATKTDESGEILCEIKAQMTVTRAEIDQLAGLPAGFASTFYTDDGAPLANMELRFPKRELTVGGRLWRGEEQHEATLPLKNATADAMRFRLEPLGAIFICRLTWRAIGDEIEEVKDLLGKWCSIDLEFTDPREKQSKLALEGGGKPTGRGRKKRDEEQLEIPEADDDAGGDRPLAPHENLPPGVPPIYPGADVTGPRLGTRLDALGFDIPENERFWFTVGPGELNKIRKFVERCEAGETPNTPSVLKPYKRKVN